MKQSDKSKSNDDKIICVSVFKSGENTTTKQEYTKKNQNGLLITLIVWRKAKV